MLPSLKPRKQVAVELGRVGGDGNEECNWGRVMESRVMESRVMGWVWKVNDYWLIINLC